MGSKSVFSDPAVTERVLSLLDAGVGESALARELGVSRITVQDFILRRSIFGDDGVMPQGKRSSYSFEEKLEAVRYHVDGGHTQKETCQKYGLRSVALLKRWVKLYREEGEDALRPAVRGPKGKHGLTREQQLEQQVLRLEAEVAYLKAAAAWEKTK